MKRLISIGLLLSLITFGLPAKSYAATDGCPDTWNIDTTQYPNQELINAKKKLGVNMIETSQSKLIEFKGPRGEMPIIAGSLDKNIRNPLLYLYSESKLETKVQIEVKGCSNVGNFTFIQNWLDLSGTIFKLTSSADFSNEHPSQFSDFKKQQAFSGAVTELIKKFQYDVNLRSQLGIPLMPFNLIDASMPQVFSRKETGIAGEARFFTATLNPKCVVSQGEGAYALVFGNGKCQFSIGAVIPADTRASSSNNLEKRTFFYLFEPFTLDLTSKSTTIICIKGKITKKVSGINPKCSKGYKVKV